MANLSQRKRERMLDFLNKIKEEHKDDDSVLIALGEIESELNAKKYGLVWEEHEEAVDNKMQTHIPVFTEDRSKEITASAGGIYNFLLEGDNLHSLRLLEKTHSGKIDVIYIDPPYNTGNKDFVYEDSMIGKDDGYRHMQTGKVKTILERLFRKSRKNNKKLLSLDTAEFYAFVINNERLLKEEFRDVTAEMTEQISMNLQPKVSEFHIPEQDFFKYDPGVKDEIEYLTNAYHDYTSGYATSRVRSTSEQLFEQFCENREDIEWVYKNGDTGQQYFSIVYVDGLRNQWLFYADYIVKKKDGTVWVIETKGGESKGQNKNIDKQIANKFSAFKRYAEEKHLHWGFVRDKDNRLYINNTEFAIDMADDNWKPLSEIF